MDTIFTLAAKAGTIFGIFLFVWALYSEWTSTYVNGGCLFKIARMLIMFLAVVIFAVCRRYGWQ